MTPSGPQNARILILGDWPEQLDFARQQPFTGGSGQELGRLVQEAGGMLSTCMLAILSSRPAPTIKGKEDFSSWLCHTKSPKNHSWTKHRDSWIDATLAADVEKAHKLIALVKPNVIIALGNLAMFALTGLTSVKKWRGSQLSYVSLDWACQLIPAYHPRYIQRDYSVRATTVQDFRRAFRVSDSPSAVKPNWEFQVRPSFSSAVLSLRKLQTQIEKSSTRISVDIETRAGHLACIGFAVDKHKAFCIPLMCAERAEGYWSATEELVLVQMMQEALTHPNARCFGQNFIYDIQYIYRFWFFVPNTWYDTMLTQHLLFPGTPKGLDYLASLYSAYYVYWKDDGKLWDASTGEDQLWTYNCEDCVRTYEVMEQQQPLIAQMGLEAQWDFQQNKLYSMLLKAMFRGVKADLKNKTALSFRLMGEITEREQWLEKALGHPINIKSPLQMQTLFTSDLGFKPVISRKTGRPTLDDKALASIKTKEPALTSVITKIQELRSLGVFKSTFVDARLDADGRLRSSYNPAGTDTFRLSSSENAFGSGMNFQNIPIGGSDPSDPDSLVLPNVRDLFLPDTGYTIFDMDLQSADFYTVVWEADDDEFRGALASGIDMHGLNAKSLFNLSCAAAEVKKLHNDKRQLAKIWCHACVTAGHEMLTPDGWVKVEDYKEGTPIAVWKNGRLFFEIPSAYNRDHAVDLVSFGGESWSQEMTWDHTVLYQNRGKYLSAKAVNTPPSARLPKGGFYEGSTTETRAALIQAYQSDGYIDERGRLHFHFSKQRKVDRLLSIWPLSTIYRNKDGTQRIICHEHGLDISQKVPGSWMLDWDGDSLDSWLAELEHWDGHKRNSGRVEISSVNPQVREWVSTIAHLRGKAAAWYDPPESGFGSTVYGTSVNNRPFARLDSMKISRRAVEPTPVYCPQTSTGFWLFRREGKIGVTGNTNYGAGATNMARACGITVKEAERLRARWFQMHPGIAEWHRRAEAELNLHRRVSNAFGYRMIFFDRVEAALPVALAWTPQSTTGCVINRAWANIEAALPEVEMLIQVHDSLVGQVPTHLYTPEYEARILQAARVLVPYSKPMYIPAGIKSSAVSWGACS
jgi:uracil-DNA glycosylase family 4